MRGVAVSAAYYAMLYAARAALSGRDRRARSHAATWALFREEFIIKDEFDPDLVRDAQRAQSRAEGGERLAAETIALDEARALVETAGRFVSAVDERLAD